MAGNRDNEGDEARRGTPPGACHTVWPIDHLAPCVVSSPHSGSYYPPDLLESSCLDARTLRLSEDCYVDTLCAGAPQVGLPLIAACYARAYVDCNRDAWELDPEMFSDPLPDYVNSGSQGVLTGFGTVPRQVTPMHAIYDRPMRFQEARRRIDTVHRAYHLALRHALDRTHRLFGCAFLVDVHSMPSLPAQRGRPTMERRTPPAFVLGDRYGETAPRAFVDAVDAFLSDLGFPVGRNIPYAGGFITRHYGGDAGSGVYALQIEIDRALYMDQHSLEPNAGFDATRQVISSLLAHIAEWTRAFARKAAE